jgi:hypothetical protein
LLATASDDLATSFAKSDRRQLFLHNLDKNYGNSDKNGEHRSSLFFIRLNQAGRSKWGFA